MEEREGWNPEANEGQRPPAELGPFSHCNGREDGMWKQVEGVMGRWIQYDCFWDPQWGVRLSDGPQGFRRFEEKEKDDEWISGDPESKPLGQRFWTFNAEINYLGTLLKCRSWFSRSGWGLSSCMCKNSLVMSVLLVQDHRLSRKGNI